MANVELELAPVTLHTTYVKSNASSDNLNFEFTTANDEKQNRATAEATKRREEKKKRREGIKLVLCVMTFAIGVGIMLPQCIFSTSSIYSDVVMSCSFDNVTTIRLEGGRFKFHWGYSGSIDVNRTSSANVSNIDRLNLNLQLHCGSFKSYYTVLECNDNLVSTAEYKIVTFKQETKVKDSRGEETYTGSSGSYASTVKNNFGGTNYGVKSLKTGKTYGFSGSSLFSVDVVVKDEGGRDIYSVKRDKFPKPSYLEIKQLNTTDYPIQDLLVLVGTQTFHNMGDGDSKNKSSDICNGLCMAGFIIGLTFVVFSLLYIIHRWLKK